MSEINNTTKTKETIFAYDNQIIDMEELASKNIDTLNSKLYFMGIELTGGIESSNPLSAYFFGTLDSNSNTGLDKSLPIYHFSPKDEENNLGTLTIFLNSCTLTILNYSLLDSTLNIKLTLTNKESKEKQDKAIIQREQKQHKEQSKPLSTAMLHPLLEDNEIKCPHNGVVQLKSNKGKSITDKNIPFILESDLLYSSIVGCPNPHISGGPCTQVAFILPSARGLKKHNDDYPIMQDLII